MKNFVRIYQTLGESA
ncbi:hypothetical protein JAG56_005890 [Raoultella ornithinolytica]